MTTPATQLTNNLWGALLNHTPTITTTRASADRASMDELATPGTRTAELLGYLSHAPATTFSLAHLAEINSRQVWGLLKTPRERGLVSFDRRGGIWQLNTEFKGRAVEAACALLESKGWVCTPPGG